MVQGDGRDIQRESIPAFEDLCVTSRYYLRVANFTPIPVSSTGQALTFPRRGRRDFGAPIGGYAKDSPVSWYGAGSSRE